MIELFRTVGGVLGKVLGAGAKTLLDRRRFNQALAQVGPPPPDGRIDQLLSRLPAGSAVALSRFTDSSEFRSVTTKLVVAQLATGSRTKAAESRWSTQDELQALLRLHVPDLTPAMAERCAALLTEQVLRDAAHLVARSHTDGVLPDHLRAEAARAAAVHASSTDANHEVIQRIGSLAEVEQFDQDLRAQVAALHSKMRLPHWGTTRYVPYDQLYIPPTLITDSAYALPDEATLDAADVFETSLRCVVLGDPGGGKSTLAFKTAHDAATGKPPFSGLPFVVVLRDFARAFQERPTTITAFIEDQCRSPYQVDPPRGAVEYCLLNGRAFVIFDGLDELIDTALRIKVVEAVHAFTHRYPTVPILVTSRRIGYEEAPLDPELFPIVQLGEFSPDQVRDYAAKWFAQDEVLDPATRDRRTRAFLWESESVSDLRVNPLMLSLLCGIYSIEGYIPKNRPDVYEKCATMLFERWDKSRGVAVPLPFNSHIKSAMFALALWLFEHPARQNGLTRGELVDFVTRYLLEKRFDDEDDAADAAERFVDFCTGRAWVLSDVGSNPRQSLYGFTHRTFLEYFAARQLVRKHHTAEELHAVLAPRIAKQEWDMVAQLSLQLLDREVEDGGTEFLDLLVDGEQDTTLFAARCLAFLVPPPRLVRKIVGLSFGEYLSLARMGLPVAMASSLSAVAVSAEELLPLIKGMLQECIASAMGSDHAEPALRLVAHMSQCPAPFSRWAAHTGTFWRDVEKEFQEVFHDDLARWEGRVSWIDALLVKRRSWRGLSDLVTRWGVEVLFSPQLCPSFFNSPLAFDLFAYTEDERSAEKEIASLVQILCATPWPIYVYRSTYSTWQPPVQLEAASTTAWRDLRVLLWACVFDAQTEGQDPRRLRQRRAGGFGAAFGGVAGMRLAGFSEDVVRVMERWLSSEDRLVVRSPD